MCVCLFDLKMEETKNYYLRAFHNVRWHVLQDGRERIFEKGTNLMRGSYENCVDINAKQIACIGQICKKQDAQYTRYMSESSLPPILFRRHNNFTSPNLVYTAIPRYRKIKWKSRYQASTYRIREHHINHPMHISWWRRKNTPTERQ